MVLQVDYLPIANGVGANVESQAQYVIDLGVGGTLNTGYLSGLAKSTQFNKTLRQSSMMSSALANVISNALQINVLDDGNITNLINELAQALYTVAANYYADTGAANAYVITMSPVPASLAALTGIPIQIKIANTNTSGACTLNVNGLGAVSLASPGGGAAIPIGGLKANTIVEVVYNGAAFQVTNLAFSGIYTGGYLKWISATQCTFVPSGGNLLTNPASGTMTIPNAGVVATSTSCYVNGVAASALAASTTYLVYAAEISGAMILDFCTGQVSTTLDATTGLPIKSGDNTRVLVGSARTNVSSQFNAPSTGNISITSFWNRRRLPVGPGSSTSSTTNTAATVTAASNSVYVWPDEPVSYRITALVYNATANDGVYIQPGIDGTVVGASAGPWVSPISNAAGSAICSSFTQPTEGVHTFAAFANAVSGGTAYYQISQTIEVNG